MNLAPKTELPKPPFCGPLRNKSLQPVGNVKMN